MKSFHLVAVALTPVLLLSACGTSGFHSASDSRRDQRSYNVHDSANKKYEKQSDYTVKFKGTIVYHRTHGGHYVIAADDGTAYLPVNLPRTHREAGLRVWVKGVVYDTKGHAFKLDIEKIDTL